MDEITFETGERIDLLGHQGLKIIQNPAKFKFTIDQSTADFKFGLG